MVRSIAGHGLSMTRYPPSPLPTGTPSSFTTFALIPGSGIIADPGLQAVTPGNGEIMMAPVSVCHQVSTIGQLLCPMFSRYHIHASGLIGSPAEPNTRNEPSSYFPGMSAPHFMNVRIRVGAV